MYYWGIFRYFSWINWPIFVFTAIAFQSIYIERTAWSNLSMKETTIVMISKNGTKVASRRKTAWVIHGIKKKCLLENNELSPNSCFVVTKCDHVYKDVETHMSVERVVLSLICVHSNTELRTQIYVRTFLNTIDQTPVRNYALIGLLSITHLWNIRLVGQKRKKNIYNEKKKFVHSFSLIMFQYFLGIRNWKDSSVSFGFVLF